MQPYLDLMRLVLETGARREDRTGTGTLSRFGHQLRFDLSAGLPLLTTKKLHVRSIVHELLWFLRGETNTAYLRDNNVGIWDEWATPRGELGPVYGAQWRCWPTADGQTIDQIAQALDLIRTKPWSRRILVSAWNVAVLPDESIPPAQNAAAGKMALAPCHVLFQFYVSEGRLSCHLYQRSADIFLGLPFNIASYSLLTMMVASVCDLAPGELIHTLGDAHLYLNHLEQARQQLARKPGALPKMVLNPRVRSLWEFRYEDFDLIGYEPQAAIAAPVAV